MNILLTAGPTHEPIDAVRYIGNRSSGRMGIAIAQAAIDRGHSVTLILGPVAIAVPKEAKRIDVITAAEMDSAVMASFPEHDLLIMAAAVADFRPASSTAVKIPRSGGFTLELVPNRDILAAAGDIKQPHQRTIGFSLETRGHLHRTREKLATKKCDLIVYNPTATLDAEDVDPALLYADGREEFPGLLSKLQFGQLLIQKAEALF